MSIENHTKEFLELDQVCIPISETDYFKRVGEWLQRPEVKAYYEEVDRKERMDWAIAMNQMVGAIVTRP